MIKNILIKNEQGMNLPAIIHYAKKESKKAIIFCHGMRSNRQGTKANFLCNNLSKFGFTCVRFDFRYTAESADKFENITITGEKQDLLNVYNYLLEQGMNEIFVIGSSLGGTVSALFASENEVKALILISSPFIFEELITRWFSKNELVEFEQNGTIISQGQKINYTFLTDALSYDFNSILKNIRCPVLLIHGEQDQIVPISNSEYANGLINKAKDFVRIENGDHRLNSHLDILLNYIKKFLIP